jgi:flavorubredoxin
MDVAIVYETLFGPTRSLADALAEGVQAAQPWARVTVLPVDDAPPEHVSSAGLLMVGSPTHPLGTGRATTREPIREWLTALPVAPPGARAAAFTTRASSPLAGSAAKGIARRLRRAGYLLAAEPQGFVVAGPEGPLRDGERDRARTWAARLVDRLVAPPPG